MLNKENSLKEIKWRIERFVSKNILLFGILFLSVTVYQSMKIDKLAIEMKDMKKVQEQELNSVIGLTDSGTVVAIEKQKFSAIGHEEVVSRALMNLVVSRAELTNTFKDSNFQDPNTAFKTMLKNANKLDTFFKEYVLINSDSEHEKKYEKIQQRAIGYFKSYLETLRQKLIENKIPHLVNILDYRIKDYSTNGNKFNITMEIDYLVNFWVGRIKGKDIWKNYKATNTIEAEGFFDIKTRTLANKHKGLKGINRLGLHFEKFKITIPEPKLTRDN